MEAEQPTTAELLDAWRDAARAAQLAERLASVAADAAAEAEQNAAVSEQIAQMAEEASQAAHRAAEQARSAADRARTTASRNRDERVPAAGEALAAAQAGEIQARDRYHNLERVAHERHEEPTHS